MFRSVGTGPKMTQNPKYRFRQKFKSFNFVSKMLHLPNIIHRKKIFCITFLCLLNPNFKKKSHKKVICQSREKDGRD